VAPAHETPSAPVPVIIVHHNTPDLLARCLQALLAAPVALLPIVVDTSPQSARARARQQVASLFTGHSSAGDWSAGDWSAGRFINCQNHSLAHAVNTGLQAALPLSDHPALVCMNADVFVRPEAWEPLLAALKPPQVGMVGPVCYDGRGQLQRQGVWYQQYYLRLQYLRWTQQLGTANYVNVPWLSGCLQVIKREALVDVGGMNSSLRFYNEDLEWCWRLRRAGWACHLIDTARASFEQPTENPPSHAHGDISHGNIFHGNIFHGNIFHGNIFHKDIYRQTQPVVHLGGSATPAHASFVIEGYRGGYRLSQMYRSPMYQTLHRSVLRGLIQQQTRQKPTEQKRFDALRRRLARGNLFESPFGDTLSEGNPHFEPMNEHITQY